MSCSSTHRRPGSASNGRLWTASYRVRASQRARVTDCESYTFPPPSSDSRPQRCAPAITCPGGGSKVLRWTTCASTAARPVAGSARSFIEPRARFSRCAGTPRTSRVENGVSAGTALRGRFCAGVATARFLVGRLPVGLRLRRDTGHERGHCVLGDMVYTLLRIHYHNMVFDHDGGKRGRTARGIAWGTVRAQFLGGNYLKNICA